MDILTIGDLVKKNEGGEATPEDRGGDVTSFRIKVHRHDLGTETCKTPDVDDGKLTQEEIKRYHMAYCIAYHITMSPMQAMSKSRDQSRDYPEIYLNLRKSYNGKFSSWMYKGDNKVLKLAVGILRNDHEIRSKIPKEIALRWVSFLQSMDLSFPTSLFNAIKNDTIALHDIDANLNPTEGRKVNDLRPPMWDDITAYIDLPPVKDFFIRDQVMADLNLIIQLINEENTEIIKQYEAYAALDPDELIADYKEILK